MYEKMENDYKDFLSELLCDMELGVLIECTTPEESTVIKRAKYDEEADAYQFVPCIKDLTEIDSNGKYLIEADVAPESEVETVGSSGNEYVVIRRDGVICLDGLELKRGDVLVNGKYDENLILDPDFEHKKVLEDGSLGDEVF